MNGGRLDMHYKINFHFTNKCDMACKHCFGVMNETEPENVLEVFKRLKYLTNSVNLAGGEIFLNIDLLHSIIQQAVIDKIHVSIVSNGLNLLNHLDDARVLYILKHIYQLGISIDSFNDEINQVIGRKTLNLQKLISLSKICKTNQVLLKINTVVTKVNLHERMVDKIEMLSLDTWKIIQVFSQNDRVMISNDQFEIFVRENSQSTINIKEELSEGITCSYAMINGQGQLYLNSEVIDGFNLIDFITEHRKESSKLFNEVLIKNGFVTEKYFSRYRVEEKLVKFDLKKFNQSVSKRTKKDKNILFIDVEGITPRDYETKKYPHLTLGFKPVLYTGLILNNDLEHIKSISDYLNPKDNIIQCMVKNDKTTLAHFYQKLAKEIINSKVGWIVSSGKDSELTFFQEMVYYANLSRNEFEYILDLMNNMFDIQDIVKSKILDIDSKVQSSRRILNYLNEYRSDLFPYKRNGEKDDASSFNVSKELASLYLIPHKFTKEQIRELIEKNTSYCFEDVFDDVKLFKTYHSFKNLQEVLI